MALFRRTSTAPARTGWPASNSMLRTTPPDSVVTSAPLTATKVPTASASSLQASVRAFALLTATAGCGMLSKNLLVCAPIIALMPNTPPKITRAATSIRIMRLRVEGGRLVVGFDMGAFASCRKLY